MALRLISKTTGNVLAVNDCALFHAAKGNNAKGRPYGIVRSRYKSPFELSFDGLSVYINAGMMSIYGRQIEITEKTLVLDFASQPLESSSAYCTVYMELDLDDITDQKATLKLDIRGNSWKDFDTIGTQNNLHASIHGIFEAPIARFRYSPEEATPFSQPSLLIPAFSDEGRASTELLTMEQSITNKKISDLATEIGGKLKWNLAREAETATGAMSLGGVTVAEDLSNLYTSRRFFLGTLTANSFKTLQLTSVAASVDWDHLQAIRLFIRNTGTSGSDALNGTIDYRATRNLTTTRVPAIQLTDGCDLEKDFWIYPSDIPKELSIAGRFSIVAYYPSTGAMSTKAEFVFEEGGIEDTDDGFISADGAQNGRHVYLGMTLYKAGSYARLQLLGNGGYSESRWVGPQYADWVTFQYGELAVNAIHAAIYADFIYKGDARL